MISAGSDTWIYYVYLRYFSFPEVVCVSFVVMATNTVETIIFAFGYLFPRIAKSWYFPMYSPITIFAEYFVCFLDEIKFKQFFQKVNISR